MKANLARWWSTEADGRVRCELCPRFCTLAEGQRGFCFVRQNQKGQLVLSAYGQSTGFCIDPIEKKPLNHFYPGSAVLSFGTAGCNLGCRFCQNWNISKSREVESLSQVAAPEKIAAAANQKGCKSVAFTYNDPVIFAEYAIDTARVCRDQGLQSVAVTAGYMEPAPRKEFYEGIDAVNVDLKAFSDTFYRKVTFARLDKVLDTLLFIYHDTKTWLEITNLIIPGYNDDAEELQQMCTWIAEALGPEVPVHFSAFHPDFKMRDVPATSKATLLKAYQIAQAAGLQFVYVGNVHDRDHDTTYCPECKKVLIRRDWYQLLEYNLEGSHCRYCGTCIPGRFDSGPGDWGRKRQAVLF